MLMFDPLMTTKSPVKEVPAMIPAKVLTQIDSFSNHKKLSYKHNKVLLSHKNPFVCQKLLTLLTILVGITNEIFFR